MKQLTLRGVGGKMPIMMVLRQCLGFALNKITTVKDNLDDIEQV